MTTPNFIFVNNLFTREEIIRFLEQNENSKIILDTTSFNRNDFLKFKQIVAFTSTKLSLGPKAEAFILNDHDEVLLFLKSLGVEVIESKLGDGYFHVPRILSTIVNEAYYALEDRIATKEDIDRAMKFGVNYPCGPFQWSAGRENFVVTLLDNLYQDTKNDRYLTSNLLRLESTRISN